ncbi:alcohol dehydrogenase catalytic domain-containing protein [Streptomyces sp. Da 82-17]|uniref:alcohol dehydrogenase catalytic domain-containing protein n=1 Tax=Streptomyces sp. Da 82-17 TaxID=3377116 RepID=UPI0038D4883C
MTHEVRAVVVREKGAPASVETVLVPDPGPGEVLVRVDACGICPVDLHHREGRAAASYPVLLGHEAAGVVEAAGAGTRLAPGDFVVLNWRAPCGSCRLCRRGRPWHCRVPLRAARSTALPDGAEPAPVLGVGGFAEKTLVAEGQCVRVDPAVSPVAAALLGCGVLTGFGAAVRTGAVGRGDSVAVIGCGTVGLAAVAGARAAGARRVVGVDTDGRRLDRAERLGATGTVDASRIDPADGVRALTDGLGADVVVDATGTARTARQALRATASTGVAVLASAPGQGELGAPGAVVELPLRDLHACGAALCTSWYGDSLPSRDLPALVDLHLAGRLDLGAFQGERLALADVAGVLARAANSGGAVVLPGR